MMYFNPRAPYGARRGGPGPELGACAISIHAPHTGRDCCPVVDLASFILFQSTRPIRGATRPKMPIAPPISNFNPRAPYGARRKIQIKNAGKDIISIHAPHTGRDPDYQDGRHTGQLFQSTRPIRGATSPPWLCSQYADHFNPRAPYGARRPTTTREIPRTSGFQSTRPIRGATSVVLITDSVSLISIHAPHTGRDSIKATARELDISISIHAPHTGRDVRKSLIVAKPCIFQSTRPIRGATLICPTPRRYHHISIHAPHTGRDQATEIASVRAILFQSTRPIRGATVLGVYCFFGLRFQSTRPIRGATICSSRLFAVTRFQSTRPIRGATCNAGSTVYATSHFNPRAPYGARHPAHPVAIFHQ